MDENNHRTEVSLQEQDTEERSETVKVQSMDGEPTRQTAEEPAKGGTGESNHEPSDEHTETQADMGEPSGGMVLRTEGLVKRYGKRTVVNNVSINVRQGEIVGLLGPNGAGKTTSFYMTTGLIVPNAGHIYLDDKDITGYPVYKRARAGVGYLPQEASVFRKMSVEDNIMSVLEMTGKPHQYQLDKLESLINEFRLNKVRKNKGDQLSGGERRRTEIARCLAIEPKFIMLDEPFAGVDPIAVEDIQHIVWRLKYRNIGILITDHNVQETLTITDRAYLLFEGKILFQGKPEELAANKVVREKYLSNSFVLRKKDFQLIDEEKRAKEAEEDG
jgi:lipopolysaccharide export system ATP-binding protein